MKKKRSLSSRELMLASEFGSSKFKSTADLTELELSAYQTRALDAMRYAMTVAQPGFNVFAAGPYGLGKCEIVQQALLSSTKHLHSAKDWCYVHNFQDDAKPIVLEFPPQKAPEFKQKVSMCVGELQGLMRAQAPLEPLAKMLKDCLQEVRALYKDKAISDYLDQFEQHFLKDLSIGYKYQTEFPCWKYQVNVLVTQAGAKLPPIVYEYNPSKESLFGKVEYKADRGSISANFNLLDAGSLHRANGGYLILDANKLLLKQEIWDTLKQTLQQGQITWLPCANTMDGVNLSSIKPQAIPLDVKIILLGSRSIYYMLCEEDPEFNTYFKVMADFDGVLEKSKRNNLLYARTLAALVNRNNLRHLDRDAVKEVMRLSSRYIEDVKKLSLELEFIRDTLIEADYAAAQAKHAIIKQEDVKKSFANKQARISRLPQQMLEDVERKYILMDVKSEKIGQINGLTIESQGDISYGHPVRITAVARIGRSSEVVNIDREVDLSGSIHNKGMMILSSYLKGKYLLAQPLSISASIAFEQTYEGVDGDSASVAELMALLSAIAEVPVDQAVAVTGSINQHGEVQAVSGLNDKIESFFSICKQAGLTGNQGVIIPDSNRQNLILSDEVLAAIAKKKFHVYPIKLVEEAIPLLTNETAGRRNKYGLYPAGTFNYKVEHRLKEFTKEVIEEKTGE